MEADGVLVHTVQQEYKHIDKPDDYFSGGEEGEKPDDGVFDIITEEEVSGVSNSHAFTNTCSPGHDQQGAPQL